MSKYRPVKTAEQWRQIILDARKSGLSDLQYCRNQGIPSSSFYSALKRLRKQACEIPDKASPVPVKQEVVQVNLDELSSTPADPIRPAAGDAGNPAATKTFEATIRITVGGSTLELTNDADLMIVGPLLKVLKSSC